MTHTQKNKNYTGIVVALTIIINGVIALLFSCRKATNSLIWI